MGLPGASKARWVQLGRVAGDLRVTQSWCSGTPQKKED